MALWRGGQNKRNSRNFDLGDAYKGATTDAITKIGSYLEIGIDVFKGNGNSSQNGHQNNTEQPEKWLNTMDIVTGKQIGRAHV